MMVFDFEDRIFELDSALLCNLDGVSGNTNVQGGQTTNNVDDVNDPNKVKEPPKENEGDKVPPPKDNNKKDPPETTLKPPLADPTVPNTKTLFFAIDAAEKTVNNIVDLLQAIIKMNRERKDLEVKLMWSECQNICNNIQAQAEKMKADAVKSLVIGLVTAGVSVVCGMMQVRSAVKSVSAIHAATDKLNTATEGATRATKNIAQRNFDAEKAIVDSRLQKWAGISEAVKNLGTMAGSVSDYMKSTMEADNKKIDAINEVLRTAMEEIKKSLDEARNSITSAQSNINELLQTHRQTTNKVLG